MKDLKVVSQGPEETFAIATQWAKGLQKGDIVALFGELGSGKTTFLKGLISQLAHLSPDEVSSPTFTYLHIYKGTYPIYHFDLYRLKGAEDFTALGFEEFFQAEGICCIEWPERIEKLLPSHAIRLHLSHLEEDRRKIEVVG